LNTVKEQRVDGSWSITNYNKMLLRCTLMGFERNYQIKIPTKQLINRNISTLNHSKINPWSITGFSDAEASFIISIYKNKNSNSKLKWRVTPNFSIHIHIKDIAVLEVIKNTLGVGKVIKNSSSTAVFRVDNIQELQTIVDHFNMYPLISAKITDFLLFKQCYNFIKQKQHLTQEGLEKIVALKCNLNKGLSDDLMKAFPNIVPTVIPPYKFKGIPNPFWISAFVSGNSTFNISLEKNNNNKIGHRVQLIFSTCLNIRDKELLIGIAKYLKILEESKQSNLYFNKNITEKYIYDSEKRETTLLEIKNYYDIEKKIIPFFNDYPMLGMKSLEFYDFKKVAKLMLNQEHLTESGFSEIKKIVEKRNLDRNNL
jgi:hypothetical protein